MSSPVSRRKFLYIVGGGVAAAAGGAAAFTLFRPTSITTPTPAEKGFAGKQKVIVGGMLHYTGIALEYFRPWSDAVIDAFRYAEETGVFADTEGELVLEWADIGHRPTVADAAYSRWKSYIPLIFGPGTAETLALSPKTTADKIPMFTHSFAVDASGDPRYRPYNFIAWHIDYSSIGRLAVKLANEMGVKKIGLIGANHPYVLSPKPAIYKTAEELGIKVVGDEVMGFFDVTGKEQLLRLRSAGAELIWHGGVSEDLQVIAKETAEMGWDVPIVTNGAYGWTDRALKNIGKLKKDRIYLHTSSVTFSDVLQNPDRPASKWILEVYRKYRPQLAGRGEFETSYIRGFIEAWGVIQIVKWMFDAGFKPKEINGPNVKEFVENNVKDYDFNGLTMPMSFSAETHQPVFKAKLYRWNGERLEFVRVDEVEKMPLDWYYDEALGVPKPKL